MDTTQKKITLPVRQLVEFLLRGGDLDNRYGGFDRAVEGTRIHKRLQRAGGDSYEAEVSLSLETDCGEYVLLVEGRADGILTDESGVIVDEIKTTGVPLRDIGEDFNRMHWAQASCYGHMLCVRDGLDSVRLRLTYFQVETEEIKRFVRLYTAEELSRFYSGLIAEYRKWSDAQKSWADIRNASVKALAFPFEKYRSGQRQLAVAVYRTVRDGGRLFCQAPTGIGKTISTLFPSIKAIGEGETEKIFYLTAKTITRQVAESACSLMRAKGLRLRSVTLTAKDKICFQEATACNPEACPFAAGHYDRVNDAVWELLTAEDVYTRERIETAARKHRVCPHELSLDMTLWSDCIIGDYNYLFDPQVYLRRFFSGDAGPYTFLIDEAHNLVDSARDMYSASLHKSMFLSLHRSLPKNDKLRRPLSRINSAMVAMRKECGEERTVCRQDAYEEFQRQLERFTAECEEWFRQHPESPQGENVLDAYFNVLSFLRIAELYDERYTTMLSMAGNEVHIRYFCLDPSRLLRQAMLRGKTAVLFSATLTPLSYFSEVLGGEAGDGLLMLPSPFPRENLCLLIADRISTRYRDREGSLERVAEQIARTAQSRPGHYIVYFPSYSYMEMICERFSEAYPALPVLIQRSGMEEAEREAFLRRFEEEDRETLIGFCVLGGIYAEGIDLKGDRLIGTVIVGVGLPQIGPEQDVIRAYYDRRGGKGFAFAYQYPGMNKVLQAAGRVIRDETDRGVVVLIDERFTSTSYRPLFPVHWQGYRTVRSGEQLSAELSAFWSWGT